MAAKRISDNSDNSDDRDNRDSRDNKIGMRRNHKLSDPDCITIKVSQILFVAADPNHGDAAAVSWDMDC